MKLRFTGKNTPNAKHRPRWKVSKNGKNGSTKDFKIPQIEDYVYSFNIEHKYKTHFYLKNHLNLNKYQHT